MPHGVISTFVKHFFKPAIEIRIFLRIKQGATLEHPIVVMQRGTTLPNKIQLQFCFSWLLVSFKCVWYMTAVPIIFWCRKEQKKDAQKIIIFYINAIYYCHCCLLLLLAIPTGSYDSCVWQIEREFLLFYKVFAYLRTFYR